MAKEKFRRIALAIAAVAVLMTPAVAQQVVGGKVTNAAPTYVDGTSNALSLDTLGNLRVTAAGAGAASTNITQTCSVNLPADDAAAAGCPLPVGGIFNAALPTYTAGDRVQSQYDARGGQFVVLKTGGGTAQSTISPAGDNIAQQSGLWTNNINLLWDGATYDLARGDSVGGAWTQGNVANGVADTGNPVKIGGVYNTTLPTLTNGQRGDMQLDPQGRPVVLLNTLALTGIDGFSNNLGLVGQGVSGTSSSSGRLFGIAGFKFNNATWDKDYSCTQSAIINVAAAATTQLVALSGSTIIRVCGFTITGDTAATTATFVYGTGANCGTGTTALTGAMRMVDEGNIVANADTSIFRTAAANALCLTAATGAVTGFVTYAQY